MVRRIGTALSPPKPPKPSVNFIANYIPKTQPTKTSKPRSQACWKEFSLRSRKQNAQGGSPRNGKSPGQDGIPMEFYKSFWDRICFRSKLLSLLRLCRLSNIKTGKDRTLDFDSIAYYSVEESKLMF